MHPLPSIATAIMQRVALLTHVLILAAVLQGQALGNPGLVDDPARADNPTPLCGLTGLPTVYQAVSSSLPKGRYRATPCEEIATTISSASEVFYPGESWVILAVVVACHSLALRFPGV